MYLEILVGILGVLLLFLYFKSYWKYRKYLQNVPGPKPNIIFGNTLDFMTSTEKLYAKLIEYIETYGSIVKVHDGPFSVGVVISDYKLLEYVLNSPKLIEKADHYEYLHRWLGDGLLTSGGTKWKNRRKMLTPSFHFSILSQFIDIFDTVGNIFIEKLDKQVGKPSVDIAPLVSLFTLDVICEAAMGTPVNALLDGESEYVRSVKTTTAIVLNRIISPLHKLLYPLTPNCYKEARTLKVLHSFTDEVIDKRIRSLSNGVNENVDTVETKRKLAFLDLLLQSTIDGKPLTRTELREEVDTFMFEGHDTTSSAITFALYSLAMHSDIQRKVLDEQRSIFGDIRNARVTLSDLQNMKYLELVIKETLRLFPPVPMYGRKIVEEFEWDGSTFPKHLNLLVFLICIHKNPKYFPDPEKFIPERFANWPRKDPFSYLPFSAGPRNCIGQKFAMLEMKSALSKVIRNFELRPSKPEHVLRLAPEVVLVSKNGVCISLKRRDQL